MTTTGVSGSQLQNLDLVTAVEVSLLDWLCAIILSVILVYITSKPSFVDLLEIL